MTQAGHPAAHAPGSTDPLRFHRPHAHLAAAFGTDAFALKAAYAAPLILLAQTRQAARDKAQADADAQHREALAIANEQRQHIAEENATRLMALLEQNTRLTEITKALGERIEGLTLELHQRVLRGEQGR